MTTPNKMPRRNNKLQQQMLEGLIANTKHTWKKKILVADDNGKERLEEVHVTRQALRYPLAQNVSEQNVESAARRWLK